MAPTGTTFLVMFLEEPPTFKGVCKGSLKFFPRLPFELCSRTGSLKNRGDYWETTGIFQRLMEELLRLLRLSNAHTSPEGSVSSLMLKRCQKLRQVIIDNFDSSQFDME